MLFVVSFLTPFIALYLLIPPVVIYPFVWAALKMKWNVNDEWMLVIGVILTALWVFVSPELGYLNWLF